jgi:hypothetical protein
MSYIDGNLLAGEQVVYRTRLHWLLFMGDRRQFESGASIEAGDCCALIMRSIV